MGMTFYTPLSMSELMLNHSSFEFWKTGMLILSGGRECGDENSRKKNCNEVLWKNVFWLEKLNSAVSRQVNSSGVCQQHRCSHHKTLASPLAFVLQVMAVVAHRWMHGRFWLVPQVEQAPKLVSVIFCNSNPFFLLSSGSQEVFGNVCGRRSFFGCHNG